MQKYCPESDICSEQALSDKCLSFRHSMPALCYAHGITWSKLIDGFPQVFSPEFFYDSIKGPEWPSFQTFLRQDFSDCAQDIVDEINDRSRWNLFEEITSDQWDGKKLLHSYDIMHQLHFVEHHRVRWPKTLLEITSTSNTITHAVDYLGIPYIFIDVDAKSINDTIAKIDLEHIDTIVMTASVELLSNSEFDTVWTALCQSFSGRFIITNGLDNHPIEPRAPQFCHRIDDEFYDALCGAAASCWHRDRSHLVLEF